MSKVTSSTDVLILTCLSSYPLFRGKKSSKSKYGLTIHFLFQFDFSPWNYLHIFCKSCFAIYKVHSWNKPANSIYILIWNNVIQSYLQHLFEAEKGINVASKYREKQANLKFPTLIIFRSKQQISSKQLRIDQICWEWI